MNEKTECFIVDDLRFCEVIRKLGYKFKVSRLIHSDAHRVSVYRVSDDAYFKLCDLKINYINH